jgi:SprT protein
MSIYEYLQKHLPDHKASLILGYLQANKCFLKITKPRKTKRGDFRHNGRDLSISVNHDNNSYRFLFTLVHEMAHLKTFVAYKNTVLPHGVEWKKNFKELFYELKMDEVFGKDEIILKVIRKELENPKACSGVNLDVEKAFTLYDEIRGIYLDEVAVGQRFNFRSGVYEKLETRRSRVLCLNVVNQKKYTINKAALVQLS